jgi:copper transport protein
VVREATTPREDSFAGSIPTISGMVRRLSVLLFALVLVMVSATTAHGHALVVSSSPEAGAIVDASPEVVSVTFTEPVQLLRPEDLEVVDANGSSVVATPGRVTGDRRVIEVGLRPGLPDGTYTVRYQIIGADSHVIPGVFVFGVGVDAVGAPVLGDAAGGPSETGPWGVAARFAEMVTLGGLFGLIVFRWAVWWPAWRRARDVEGDEREALLTWWRDTHWMIFGVLAVAAMLAQAFGLVVQSARVLQVGVLDALRDSAGISSVLRQTDYGTHVQARAALLFVLFATGAVQFMREYGSGRSPRRATAGGGPWAALAMGTLVLLVIGSIAGQGHARVSETPWLQIGAQLVHIAGSAVWIAGLALAALVFVRAPRVAPRGGGRAIAGRALLALSAAATMAIIAVVATGLLRSIAELGDPAELWQTAYGRSILIKLGLLVPLVAIALYNRRIAAALRSVDRPNGATVALVQRTVGTELGLGLAIVLVAALLAGQIPGG